MANVKTSPNVTSVAKTGSTKLNGDVTLTGGTNVTLTQSGQDISIAASGGGGGSGFTTVGDATTGTACFDGTNGSVLTGKPGADFLIFAANGVASQGSTFIGYGGNGDTNSNGGSSELITGDGNGTGSGGFGGIFGGTGGGTSGSGGEIDIVAGNGGSPNGSGADLYLYAGGSHGSGISGSIRFDTANDGSTSGHDRMVIDSSGNVKVNNLTGSMAVGTDSSKNLISINVPIIRDIERADAQTAADTSVATYTVGASDGSFLISANVNVTAFAVGTFNVTCAYTDETGASNTLKLNFSSLTGTLGIAIAATGAFEGIPTHIRAQAGTAITIATSGTFTSLTYNVEGIITQIA